jgi:hypothetical protein
MHCLSHLFNSRNIYTPTVIIYAVLDTYIGTYLHYLYAREMLCGNAVRVSTFYILKMGHAIG